MSISERIKMVRDFYGLSQEEFGERLGLGRSHISLLENAKRGASDRTLNDICDKYGVSREWLIEGKGEMRSSSYDMIEALVLSLGDVSEEDREIISTYLRLPKSKRQVFGDFLREFSKEKKR